ncbi:nicotinamide N-methyltransferase-like [Dysidea avara]|uniref:nicotinamide N-methyltransferase-like n=1 Tax=Dysidea avara TaxID=196820 RepID=UPI0033299A09
MIDRYSDVRNYLQVRYPDVFSEGSQSASTKRQYVWFHQCFHHFYQTYNKQWDNATAVLLEAGGGPCIYPLISAAPYVAEIYHSDYMEANREEVLMWRNNDPDAYDWSPYFRHIVQSLEGQTSHDAVARRKERLRSVLKDSAPCDFRANIVVPSVKTPVNIISSNFCMDVCYESLGEYIGGLKKVYDMLVPKGFLVSLSTLGLSWCKYGDVTYLSSYPLSLEDIQTHCKGAGFNILHTDKFDEPLESRNIYNDSVGYSLIIAQKP